MEQNLYALLEGINRAESLGAVYQSAMEFIRSALGCKKVSVLLLDEGGVMRFVAWDGLSEEYRRALEGHSPWRADEPHPRPVCIEDTDLSALDERVQKHLRAEHIRALAFIPLIYKERLLGKFMVYFDLP